MMTDGAGKLPGRHEVKHQISLREDLVLSQRLRHLFDHDRNAGADGSYRVTSLYFDTPYDSALREKADGVDRREKFRLRYYGADLSHIRLEKKSRQRGLCKKSAAAVSREQAEKLLAGDDSWLLGDGEPLLTEFYGKLRGKLLRPAVIVRYDREAFVYEPGNVRITLDRNIRTGLGNTEFLNSDIFWLRALEYTVLEVKYGRYLPDIVRMAVQVPGRQACACSKYALCRRFD